jgi:hypothetical protein
VPIVKNVLTDESHECKREARITSLCNTQVNRISRHVHEIAVVESPRVTTVTSAGFPSGEYSKESFARWWWSPISISAPASHLVANFTVTRALRT